ncbi:hypothetical protein [Exiguobacterium flavidum]|uniref:hypothetical protein n=1 Tax=Exiguobacterium flavidum TaxID=2184695 RepID=UPI000DF7A473|nr:hypothetical protein [Exiguobacterium flavidum]
MENHTENHRAFEQVCLQFVELVVPEDMLDFVNEQTVVDVFHQSVYQRLYQGKRSRVKLSFVRQSHGRHERVFLTIRELDAPHYEVRAEGVFRDGEIWLDHVRK